MAYQMAEKIIAKQTELLEGLLLVVHLSCSMCGWINKTIYALRLTCLIASRKTLISSNNSRINVYDYYWVIALFFALLFMF